MVYICSLNFYFVEVMSYKNNITANQIRFLVYTFVDFLRKKYMIKTTSLNDEELSDKAFKYTSTVGLNNALENKTTFRNQYQNYIDAVIDNKKLPEEWLSKSKIAYPFLEFITIHFFKTPLKSWLKNNSISNDNINNTFSNLYFDKLFNYFSEHDDSEDSILKRIKDENKLSKSDQEWILGVVPEIFLNKSIRKGETQKEYFGLYDGGTQYMSNPILFNGDSKKYHKDNEKKLYSKTVFDLYQNYKGTYLVHALSPLDDNMFIFCELGRFARISDSANIFFEEKKEAKIFCVDDDWSEYNLTIKELEIGGADLDYVKNKQLRKKIYEKILININKTEQKFRFHNFKEVQEQFEEKNIDKEVDQYHKLATNKSVSIELLKNDYNEIIKDVETSTEFINNIKKSFVSDEEDTLEKNIIKYVLFQRYLQVNLEKYLKIAILREFDFDNTFNQLNGSQKTTKKDYESYGLYFKDYVVKVPKKDSKNGYINRKTHPYFFPSGDYYNTLKNESDIKFKGIRKKDGTFFKEEKAKFDALISNLKKNVILVSDYNDYDKILEIINRYRMKELAVIMCDFISFIYYYFDLHISSDLFKESGFNKEFLQNWKKSYHAGKRDKTVYKKHFSNFLAFSYNTNPVPFYFFPYIYAFEELEKEEKTFKEQYAKLIHNTLIKINNDIS